LPTFSANQRFDDIKIGHRGPLVHPIPVPETIGEEILTSATTFTPTRIQRPQKCEKVTWIKWLILEHRFTFHKYFNFIIYTLFLIYYIQKC
jgi:hypothetical protein